MGETPGVSIPGGGTLQGDWLGGRLAGLFTRVDGDETQGERGGGAKRRRGGETEGRRGTLKGLDSSATRGEKKSTGVGVIWLRLDLTFEFLREIELIE